MSITAIPKVTPQPPRHALPTPPPHHVNSPPTSFQNPWPSFHSHSFLDLFLTSRRNRDFKPVPSRDQLVNVVRPDWGSGQEGLKATWIGHASFLVETPIQDHDGERGVRILFDPLFSERTSPVSWAGPKRYTPTPCTLAEVPEVDLVAISHDHYDHLDAETLRAIYARRKGKIHFLVPLGNAARLHGMGIASEDVTQLDWWEGVQVEVPSVGNLRLTCTPAQHISGRALWDRMSTLWGSWVLECGDTSSATPIPEPGSTSPLKLFFAGDTGYRYVPEEASEESVPFCPAFRETGEEFGPFDLSLLPIGLYAPRHLLSPVHCTPEDAVCLHRDLRSKKSIGMHYGTVRGGISQYFEEVTEPPRRFREACETAGMVWGKELGLLDVGQTVVVR
ncbi:N-acyl-phosphatidylethanolamine-hydrolysing phospholipase D [Lasallia pustulata]|uniref:N-acyl-phosphatidylethanolamine-hydrolysing phospholipase D n=1 Tax=Lasallia pustulata TaxID=136370 RepID=A0A1W5DBF7_9LECA|nr:N-acyl-phosphatidylethanolamine-hydrolysing phospholipase D [Lasallia pustulata]